MSRLTDLIAKTKAKDSSLGAELEREFKVLSARLPFGLNFERHSPEAVELPLRPVRKGDKVRVLPVRGTTRKGDQRLWQVKTIHKAKKTADLELLEAAGVEARTVALDDLVVVAEFRDIIYPGLVSTGKVQRGGDKACHTVINGENYHVLKALTYTHRGKVDAIYIDPPYNSGAKDWKYNNDYVDKEDVYRHSKWLAMIERRLLVAKELLNPADSVLIVTIDEKEYLRLGLLLEQLFPEARMQMISSSINPKGSARGKEFYRVDEYIFFLAFGRAVVQDFLVPGLCITKSDASKENDEDVGVVENTDDVAKSEALPDVRWASLLRSGSGAQREESHLKFYPIYVDIIQNKIVGCGDPLPLGEHPVQEGADSPIRACWPTRQDGSEGRWQLKVDSFKALLKDGHVKIGSISAEKITFYYLMEGQRKKLTTGELVITGKDGYGGIIVEYARADSISGRPKTQWMATSHSATDHGTSMLRKMIPKRPFPFPKSLYAVEDALRFFVGNKPEAVILDFFSGSGTTAHAVMRLNKQDGGRRQCISVTNNEVGADEQTQLRKKGLRPGDPDWEALGICDYITKPRIAAAITGKTPGGEPIKGGYKFTDEFPMAEGFEENAEFFTLTYETPVSVSYNLAFNRISPLLWLRAGARGNRIDMLPNDGWAVVDAYGLLSNVDAATPFIKALAKADGTRIAYIVTDDDRRFQAIAKRLPDGIEPVRLYESYLTNFSFTNGE
ncbi:TPA: site-specific DNA-methyltransferase [Klebsiella pneumoniae]|uniref:site-specific DNA-methyltransferase n=1 Tax=Klebsiella pneumoniae TaxID=573 RepID=UPI000E3D650E|nr:DNA methyltransferase [Klebsiella pneumoniae]HBS5592036.1 site-specific DNA-methyltransferase [Klebsiella pneumoniae]